MLINMFFGVVCNAAVSVASTVQGISMQLTSTIIQAFRPQIIKQYAADNIVLMQLLMQRATIFVVVSLSTLSIPIMLQAHYLIFLWLGQVPQDAEIFLQILLIHAVLSVYNNVCVIAIHATGKIKYISFIGGTVSLLSLGAIWLGFKCGAYASFAFWISIVTGLIYILVDYIIIKKLIPRIAIRKLIYSAVKMYSLMTVCYLIVRYMTVSLSSSFVSLVITCILSMVVVGALSWAFLFDQSMKNQLLRFISEKVLRIKNNR
jgi:O-antigen/teichoic acid export membrane protein